MNYKNIHIGQHIKRISELQDLDISRACTYLRCTHQDILDTYSYTSLDSELLLKWSKLLNYNFFMFYHSHLQLYKPVASKARVSKDKKQASLKGYDFRKNLYNPDIIDWILLKLDKKELSIKEIMEKYHIPKTTIYRWIKRNKKQESHEKR